MADDDLWRLGRDLNAAGSLAKRQAEDIVKKAAQNVKTGWQTRMRARSRHGHIPHLPKAIGYDVSRTALGADAVIGPDKDRKQGPLGNLLEFGSVNNPPHNDGGAALLAEAPNFYRAISKAEGGFL